LPNRTGTYALALAAVLAAGCSSPAQRLAEGARLCDRAIEIGNLDLAETYCRRALGEPGSGTLAPAVESRRLLTLGRVLRQRARYAEALALVSRSLELERQDESPDQGAVAARQVELGLIHAGRGDWRAGALSLEASLDGVDALSGADRELAAHVLRQYARRGGGVMGADRVARFRTAAQALEDQATVSP